MIVFSVKFKILLTKTFFFISFQMGKNIAVIGAGVVGLSTAMNIIDSIPFVSVTVIADKFNTETTSDGAGGLFRPNYNTTPGIPKEEMM